MTTPLRTKLIGVMLVSSLCSTVVHTVQQSKPWQLRKIQTSNVCLVQTSTSSPIGGLVSDHDTRKEACQAAKNRYDESISDVSKCWTYGPATKDGCKAEGIDLP
jgi:hypothetical protein